MKRQVVWALIYGVFFNVIYFALFSRPLYRAVGVINLYYPNALLFGILSCVLLNRAFWNIERMWLLMFIAYFVALVFLVPFAMDYCFGRVLGDLYMRGYRNMLYLIRYYKEVVLGT